jgi:hypothetical protein
VAHRYRREGEKVRAIAPFRARLIDELETGLVDQRGRLDRTRAFARAKPAVRDLAKLFVHDRQQPIERLAPAAPQLGEHIGTGGHLIESSSALSRAVRGNAVTTCTWHGRPAR